MKRARRITQALTLLLVVGLLSTPATAQRPYEGVQVTVSVWASDLINNVFRPLLPQFEEQTGIKVTFDDIAWAGLRSKQVIEMSGNRGAYDVVLMSEIWVPQYAQAGLLEPLEAAAPEGFFEGFIPSILATGQHDGTQYGVPALNHAVGLIYRTDLFEAAGLEAPRTWDDLRDAILALNKPEKGQYALSFPARTPTIAEIFLVLLRTTGANLFDSEWRPQFTSPEAFAAYELLAELVAVTPPGSTGWAWPEARSALYDGLAAMHIGGIAIYAGLDNPEITRFPGAFDVVPLPVPGDRVGEPFDSLLLNYSWGIARNSQQKEAAWKLIEWLVSPEVEAALARSGIPLQSDSSQYWYYEDPDVIEARPIAKTLFEMYQQSATAPAIPEWAEIQEGLALRLTEALLGRTTPERALEEAEREAFEVLERAGYY